MEPYFSLLLKEMDVITPIRTSSHIPEAYLGGIEKALIVTGGYEHFIPPDYPSTKAEGEHHLRRLNHPTDVHYGSIPFRIGMTLLHIKSPSTTTNIDSLLFCYLGNPQEKKIQRIEAKGGTAACITLLTSEGVIATSYLEAADSSSAIACWYPPLWPNHRGFTHPSNSTELLEPFVNVLSVPSLLKHQDVLIALGHSVLLSKKVYDAVHLS